MPMSLWMARVGRRRGFMAGALINIVGCALAVARAVAAQLRAVLPRHRGDRRLQRDRAAVPLRGGGSRVARPTRRARSRSCSPAASSADFSGPRSRAAARTCSPRRFSGSFRPACRRARSSRSPCSRASTCRSRRWRRARRRAAAVARSCASPYSSSPRSRATLGYGLMNLLMTATPLAMDFCGLPYARRRW